MKKRYKLTKEQLEKVVESYITESAAPEATKHMNKRESGKMVEKRVNTKTPNTTEPNGDDVIYAPEAKKHIKNKMDGKMVEKRSNSGTTAVKKPNGTMRHPEEAKKHIRNK